MPAFKPIKPFELSHDGENYGAPGKYAAFVREVSEAPFQIGGIYCYVYRLLGTFDQQRDALGVLHDPQQTSQGPTDITTFLGIQDPILGENRDRAYDFEDVPRLKGIYQISASELELLRYGFKSNETVSMEFHQSQVERELGRRFIIGDVIELPHLREVAQDGRVANRWFEVKNISWSPGGYDPTYNRHVVGVILQPLRHQQEFLDLFDNVRDEYGRTLADQISNEKQLLGMTEAIQAQAGAHASTTWWDTTIMWMDPDHPNRKPYKWTDDLKPDNGEPVRQGTVFPPDVVEGEWFLRTNFEPNRLYRFQNNRWKLKEIDVKREWQPYNWVVQLREFMSDRSEADRARPWELRSIHDVLTDREQRSDPTGEAAPAKEPDAKVLVTDRHTATPRITGVPTGTPAPDIPLDTTDW